jgi:hypothetical protein
MPIPRQQPSIGEKSAEDLTRHANLYLDQRKLVRKNRERISVLQEMFGSLSCTYCKTSHESTVLVVVVLARRPGLICKKCLRNFLL